jgi:hypothetical protein
VRALGNGSGLHLIAKRAGAGNLTLFYARRGKRQYPFPVFVCAAIVCLHSQRTKRKYQQQCHEKQYSFFHKKNSLNRFPHYTTAKVIFQGFCT